MAKFELTFPVFYHCAIKKNTPYNQKDAVNLLLTGYPSEVPGHSIDQFRISGYVKGTKPLPQDKIRSLLSLSDEELFLRFDALNFSNIFAVTEAIEKLLDVVRLHPGIKDQLLRYSLDELESPQYEYIFLAQVFRAALRNSAYHTVPLTQEDLEAIRACREDGEPPAEKPASEGKQTEEPRPDSEMELFLPEKELSVSKRAFLRSVRNIGTLPPLIAEGKTHLLESSLKYISDLINSNAINPLESLGDYDDKLVVRTLQPSETLSRQEIIDTFYKLIDEAETVHAPISYLELKDAMQAPDIQSLTVLECMGSELDVLHHLTQLPRLRAAKQAAMITTMSPAGNLELAFQFQRAVMDSMGHTQLIPGLCLTDYLDVGYVCVQLLLAE